MAKKTPVNIYSSPMKKAEGALRTKIAWYPRCRARSVICPILTTTRHPTSIITMAERTGRRYSTAPRTSGFIDPEVATLVMREEAAVFMREFGIPAAPQADWYKMMDGRRRAP